MRYNLKVGLCILCKEILRSMKKTTYKHFLLFLLFSFMFSSAYSCKGSKKTVTNYAYQYRAKSASDALQLQYHASSDTTTDVYLKLPDALKNNSTQNKFRFNVYLFWYNDNKEEVPVDSATLNFNISKTELGSKPIMFKASLPIEAPNIHWLKIVAVEEFTGAAYRGNMVINRSFDNEKQRDYNYLIRDPLTQLPILANYVPVNTPLTLQYRDNRKQQDFVIAYYKTSIPQAKPPYSTQASITYPTRPDSVITTNNAQFVPTTTGLYCIKTTKSNEYGKVLVVVPQSYPKLTTAQELIVPLRYITRNEEYNALNNNRLSKKAIDDFWLERAGSYARGKILIKEFYGRVQKANTLFTTQQQGWKTDQGLIYIIFGEPDYVYKGLEVEQWTYAANNVHQDIRFVFSVESNSPFTTQAMQLVRQVDYAEIWNMAVYEWRKGLIGNASFAE